MVTDNHVISVQTNNYSHENMHNPVARVKLIDWPDVTLTTATFQIDIKSCSITNYFWTSNSLPVLDLTYEINSGSQNLQLTFDINEPECTTEVSLMYDFAGIGIYNAHDLSVLTMIN